MKPLLLILALAPFAAACGTTIVDEGGPDDGEGAADGAAGGDGGDGGSSDGGGAGGATSVGTTTAGPTTTTTAASNTSTGTSGGCAGEPPLCDPGERRACADPEWLCEPAECPDLDVWPGDGCSEEGLVCSFVVEMGCDDEPATTIMTCEDGAWVERTPRCQPMPCREWSASGDCEAEGCRWLEPGCDENPLPVAGCFDELDCAENSCWYADEICTTVSVDPCWDAECDACGEQATVCVPQPDDGG